MGLATSSVPPFPSSPADSPDAGGPGPCRVARRTTAAPKWGGHSVRGKQVRTCWGRRWEEPAGRLRVSWRPDPSPNRPAAHLAPTDVLERPADARPVRPDPALHFPTWRQGAWFTGVKLGPAEISGLPSVGDLRDQQEARRRLGRLRQDPAGCRSLQEARSWRQLTFPALSATEALTLSASAVPASQLLAADQLGPPIGTRRHDPAPSTWYSSTSVFKIEVIILDLPAHRGRAAAPLIRLQKERRWERVDHNFHSSVRRSRRVPAKPCRRLSGSGQQTSIRHRAMTER